MKRIRRKREGKEEGGKDERWTAKEDGKGKDGK